MIKLPSKILTVLVNILLCIYQLPQILVGLIGLAIFRNYEVYTNEYNGISVLNVNKGNLFGTACFSAGPIIFTVDHCHEITKRHETGHSKQSLYLGPLFLLVIALPSVFLFWYRRIFNKSHEWYLDHFPENSAEKLGGTQYVSKRL